MLSLTAVAVKQNMAFSKPVTMSRISLDIFLPAVALEKEPFFDARVGLVGCSKKREKKGRSTTSFL